MPASACTPHPLASINLQEFLFLFYRNSFRPVAAAATHSRLVRIRSPLHLAIIRASRSSGILRRRAHEADHRQAVPRNQPFLYRNFPLARPLRGYRPITQRPQNLTPWSDTPIYGSLDNKGRQKSTAVFPRNALAFCCLRLMRPILSTRNNGIFYPLSRQGCGAGAGWFGAAGGVLFCAFCFARSTMASCALPNPLSEIGRGTGLPPSATTLLLPCGPAAAVSPAIYA